MTGRLELVSKDEKLTVTRQCELLDVNRSSVYYTPAEPDRERENLIKRRLDYWHTKMPYLGVRKLRRKLQDEDEIKVGRKCRYIVGWELSDTFDTAPVLAAVKEAIHRYGKPGIINSDQGSQFTSDDYTSYLIAATIRQSIDGKARWVDNVIIERWFRSLKTERIYTHEYLTPRSLRSGIREYVQEYNRQRPHETHDYLTPKEVYLGRKAA